MMIPNPQASNGLTEPAAKLSSFSIRAAGSVSARDP